MATADHGGMSGAPVMGEADLFNALGRVIPAYVAGFGAV